MNWDKLFPKQAPDSVMVMRDAVVRKNKDGTYVAIRKSFIEKAMQHPNYRAAGSPKEKLIVSLACQFAQCSQVDTIKYMQNPAMDGMIKEYESASTVFKNPLEADWQVPVYLVYLPPL